MLRFLQAGVQGLVRGAVTSCSANHTLLWVSSFPGCLGSPLSWLNSTPCITHKHKYLSKKSFFIDWGWGLNRNALGTIPRLAEGWGIGSCPASSRAPQGKAWPPGHGCGAESQAEVEMGVRFIVPTAPPGCNSPKWPPEGSRASAQRNSRLLR